ncbi:hypothetical protein OCU04_004961 [Sclerotinia nivalis]|uniref:Uncharacterized protein n=1 Tax=Sclerotinia nivalis TaxID=352851 RepID=A0A9X0AN37_9HELO|nr:hypothetical protein OCU04_004961 [Sclerotinia nivalis]
MSTVNTLLKPPHLISPKIPLQTVPTNSYYAINGLAISPNIIHTKILYLKFCPSSIKATSSSSIPTSRVESALDDADLESLKALLRASGNLYPHMRTMRTTTLKFLLGDKYVDEERKVVWSIERVEDRDKVDRKSASVDNGKDILGGREGEV